MNWQFLNSGAHSGQFNMDADMELARNLQQGSGMPTLRVYQWQPYAVSLGHHQHIEDIDLEKCSAEGIDVVRRPTGGRAILHAQELTYSVVMYPEGRTIMEAYRYIGAALLRGLRRFHPEIGMEQEQPFFPDLYRQPTAVLCFGSTSRFEIQFRGKKLVGSAQRRLAPVGAGGTEVVLQHGSILLGPEHRRLPEFVRSSGDSMVEIGRALSDRTTELSEILGRDVSFEETAEAIRSGFESEWDLKFECSLVGGYQA